MGFRCDKIKDHDIIPDYPSEPNGITRVPRKWKRESHNHREGAVMEKACGQGRAMSFLEGIVGHGMWPLESCRSQKPDSTLDPAKGIKPYQQPDFSPVKSHMYILQISGLKQYKFILLQCGGLHGMQAALDTGQNKKRILS